MYIYAKHFSVCFKTFEPKTVSDNNDKTIFSVKSFFLEFEKSAS